MLMLRSVSHGQRYINMDVDYKWAAGILEGEGCFSIFTRRGSNNKVCAIHCEMTDEDVIQKLQNVLDCGNISYRENNRGDGRTRKPSWILSIQRQKDMFDTLIRVMPYLHSRRLTKASEMFSILEEKIIK